MVVQLLIGFRWIREDRFDPGEGNLFNAAARKMNFDSRFCSRMDWVRTLEWRCQWRGDAPPLDKDVSCIGQTFGDVDIWMSMGGSWFGLEAFNFKL